MELFTNYAPFKTLRLNHLNEVCISPIHCGNFQKFSNARAEVKSSLIFPEVCVLLANGKSAILVIVDVKFLPANVMGIRRGWDENHIIRGWDGSYSLILSNVVIMFYQQYS